MSAYLARLKQLEGGKNSHHAPDSEPSKPSKVPFEGFEGTGAGHIEKNFHNDRPSEPATGDTITSRWWRIHYPDHDPTEVACCPEAIHAEILEWYPDAVAAEPFTPAIRQPAAPMSPDEEAAIRASLVLIEETDPAMIAGIMGQCQRDADARDYFTGRLLE